MLNSRSTLDVSLESGGIITLGLQDPVGFSLAFKYVGATKQVRKSITRASPLT